MYFRGHASLQEWEQWVTAKLQLAWPFMLLLVLHLLQPLPLLLLLLLLRATQHQ
jgi:hypothetical protein